MAEMNGENPPEISLTLPPGYLEVISFIMARKYNYILVEIQRSKQ